MASLRRVKVLLVLNLIAVAGFVLFLAKCRPIAVRSGDAFHEIRPRAEPANLSAHSASPIQDAVLKRLSLLEDIVYRQLNGKDSRQRPRARQTPGALSAVLGGPHLLVSARSFLLSLSSLSWPGGRGCWKELPDSFLCPSRKFTFTVETCQYSRLPVPACRNYPETPSQVQRN